MTQDSIAALKGGTDSQSTCLIFLGIVIDNIDEELHFQTDVFPNITKAGGAYEGGVCNSVKQILPYRIIKFLNDIQPR